MKKQLVSVYAVNVNGAWWAPIVSVVDDQVKADFIYGVNTKGTKLFDSFKDASLYKIASYDLVTGLFKNKSKILIATGLKCKLPDSEKPLAELVTNADGSQSFKVGE